MKLLTVKDRESRKALVFNPALICCMSEHTDSQSKICVWVIGSEYQWVIDADYEDTKNRWQEQIK